MKIIERWNEFMGPKDERLAAESNRCAAVGYTILIIGSTLCLYYGIMLNQVAETTGHPLLTPLGQSVFPVDTALLIIILASGLISTYLQVRSGTFDTHARIAQADRIPWDYVTLVSLLCGLGLGATTTVMRILAEVQIVGVENVTWGGDIAMGIVYFTLAFFWPSACSPPPSTAPSTVAANWSASWRSNRKRASGSALAARLSATLTAPGRTRGWCGRWAP